MTIDPTKPADLTQQLLLQLMNDIGALSVKISEVAGQNSLILQEQQRAADGRQGIYDRLNKLEIVAVEVARLSPMVDKHQTHYDRTAGAIGFGRFLWPMVGAAATSIATLLGLKFTGHG